MRPASRTPRTAPRITSDPSSSHQASCSVLPAARTAPTGASSAGTAPWPTWAAWTVTDAVTRTILARRTTPSRESAAGVCPERGVDLAGRRGPVQRVEVQPGGAARRAARGTAPWRPRRPAPCTASGSSATAWNRAASVGREGRARQRGEPLDLADVGHRHDARHDRHGARRGARPAPPARSSRRARKKNWVIANVRAGGLLGGEHLGVVLERQPPPGGPRGRRRRRREKSPHDCARSRTSSTAWSSPPGCRCHGAPGPPGGSPRSASTLRTPASAYCADDVAQLVDAGARRRSGAPSG